MESASRSFGSPFRHFTGVKCEKRPLIGLGPALACSLEGALVVLDPFADLASKALNLILHKRCHRAPN